MEAFRLGAISMGHMPAGIQVNEISAAALNEKIKLSWFHRMAGMVKALVSPLFLSKTVYLYESEDLIRVAEVNGHPSLRVECYDGVSAVPDEVAEVIEPLPGETLTVLYVGRRIVGFVRASFKNRYSPDIDEYIQLNAGEVYLYDLHILPEYLNTHLFSYLLATSARKFLEKGFSRVLLGTMDHSPRYRTLLEKAGFRLYQKQSTYRILGKRLIQVTPSKNGKLKK